MTPSRTRARLAAVAVAAALVAIGTVGFAPSAQADQPFGHPMPAGNWTFVRSDGYLHYACKIPMSGGYGPVYRVRTATWFNGRHDHLNQGIGVYAVTSRSNGANVIDRTTNLGWLYGFNGNELWASAWYADRLWIQAAAYGPVDPWAQGVPVRNLVNC
jgi:hypothetical protein